MEVILVNEKLKKFIDNLEKPVSERVYRMLLQLEFHGSNIKMPFSKSIGGGLFELRIVGVNNVRVLYTFYLEKAFVVHIFIKKTEKIPKKEIECAKRVRKLLQSI